MIATVLPGPVWEHLNLDSIRVEDTTYIDEGLARHLSDLVLTVDVKGGGVRVDVYWLFEHKSSPERFVGLQLLRYMALRWTDCLEDKNAAFGKLPTIVPVVICQGGKKWRAIDSFRGLVAFPPQEFREYAPDFRFEFFGIPGMGKEKLEESKDRIVLHFYLAILRSLQSPELKDILPGLIQGLFDALGAKTGMELIGLFLRYIVRASRSIKKEDVMDISRNSRAH